MPVFKAVCVAYVVMRSDFVALGADATPIFSPSRLGSVVGLGPTLNASLTRNVLAETFDPAGKAGKAELFVHVA